MRLPSFRRLFAAGLDAARRFPAVALCAAVAAVTAVLVDGDHGGEVMVGLRVASLLGLPLFLALHLMREQEMSRAGVGTGFVLAAAGLLAFALRWPAWGEETAALRALHLALATHLAVAVLPWATTRRREAYWLFHLRLLLRWLLAAVYTAVLWGGLSLALGAVDVLLGVSWPHGIYLQLFDLLYALFLTGFFLAGVPRLDEAELVAGEMPAGLRILAQGILLPLVGVYLLILLIYLGKVLALRDWPSGWIGWLVSAVSVAGILAFLLLDRRIEEGRPPWMGRVRRLYHLLLLPALVMLGLALGQRVGQYGWTEPRVFLALLAFWCAGICVWRLAGGRRLWWIPTSLLVVALLAYAGPWGAYAVARRDQAGRLAQLLRDSGILEAGALRPAPADLPPEQAVQIRDSLAYLLSHHGEGTVPAALRPTLAATDTFTTGRGVWQDRQWATATVEALGASLPRSEVVALRRPLYFESREDLLLPTAGYDRVLTLGSFRRDPETSSTELRWEADELVVEHPGLAPLRFDGQALLAALEGEAPPGPVVLDSPRARLLIEKAQLLRDARGEIEEVRLDGLVLLREEEAETP